MQVSQLKELDTHAVIGGGKAKSFTIAQTAEFFTVLSDTLYRDKKRAVIREIICNAWDAHIAGGKTDRPVEVTLTDNELIIQDFGPGIPHSKIGSIYCSYGSSTKVADDTQTGGFGLGSKAPFAYSHHFTVTNLHDGVRAVYAISRGSSETEGRPDYRCMTKNKVEGGESGVRVTIPLKSVEDRAVFNTIIRRVAFEGGMLVSLNDETLDRIDYEPARKQGYTMCRVGPYDLTESGIYVLYGTVLYPLTTTDTGLMWAANKLALHAPTGYRIILIAEPNSVGITPSRESLSYTDRTNEAIRKMIRRAKTDLSRHFFAELDKALELQMKKEGLRCLFTSAIDRRHFRVTSPSPADLHKPDVIAQLKIQDRRLDILSDLDLRRRAKKVAMHALPDHRRFIRKSFSPEDFAYGRGGADRWHRKVGARYARQIMRIGATTGTLKEMRIITTSYGVISRAKALNKTEFGIKPQRFVIIAPNQTSAEEYIRTSKLIREENSCDATFAVFPANKISDGTLNKVRAEAKRYDIKIHEIGRKIAKPRIVKKTSNKLYTLGQLNPRYLTLDGEPKVEHARFFIRARQNPTQTSLAFYVSKLTVKEIAELQPDTVVVFDIKTERRLIEKGAVEIVQAFAEEAAELAKLRDVQFAICAKEGWFIDGACYYKRPSDRAAALIRRDPRLARLILSERVKLSGKHNRYNTIETVVIDAANRSPHRYHEAMGPINAAKEKAYQAFKSKRVSASYLDKNFTFLQAINTDCSDIGLLEHLIRSGQRLQAKSALTKPNPQPMKEAA